MTTTTDSTSAIAALSQATSKTATKKTAASLGIDDFLALMTAQLKNQDPLKPLDSTEFVAQLVQFGSVSGIQNMQTSLNGLATSLRSAQALNGATLVGHDVLAPGNSAALGASDGVQGAIDVPSGASSLQIEVKDASGATVRTIALLPQDGMTNFTWDGMTSDGTRAAPGIYSFAAVANVGGKNQAPDMYMQSKVLSVTIDPQSTDLTLNTASLGTVTLASVRRIL
jgi:flagellar basal-body rod modification protein FlgD